MTKTQVDLSTVELPPTSVDENLDSPSVFQRRVNRPASIGDASQLFGGGESGLDDFFGPPPSDFPSKPTGFGTVFEEPENTPDLKAKSHDPFAWSATDQGQADDFFTNLGQSTQTENRPGSISQDPFAQPLESTSGYPVLNPAVTPLAHHQSQPSLSQPGYQVTNPYSIPSSYNVHPPPSNFVSPPTGLGTSTPDQTVPYDDHNPYAPANPHAAHNPYGSASNQNGPANSTMPLLNQRPASVDAYRPTHAARPAMPQHSSFVQPPVTSSAAASLNRPKVYDAYDPPAIRKKKITAHITTASLPSSPALGGEAVSQLGASILSPYTQAEHLPPLLKQRSVSGPIHPITPNMPAGLDSTSHHSSDFYAPTGPSAFHSPQGAFIQPNYPQAQPAGLFTATQAPIYPGFQAPTDGTHQPLPINPPISNSPPQAIPVPQDSQPFLASAAPFGSGPSMNAGRVSEVDDPYAPTSLDTATAVQAASTSDPLARYPDQPPGGASRPISPYSSNSPPPPKRRTPSPLASTGNSITAPTGPYVTDRTTAPSNLAYLHGPTSPTSSGPWLTGHDCKPKKSSPLKTALPVHEDPYNLGTHGPSADLSGVQTEAALDPVTAPPGLKVNDAVDDLALFTEQLSLEAKSPAQSPVNQVYSIPDRSSAKVSSQLPASITTFIDTKKLISVPAVCVQPATPEIPLLDTPESAPTSSFDVLADLGGDNAAAHSSQSQDPQSAAYSFGVNPSFPIQDNSGYDYASDYGNPISSNSNPYQMQSEYSAPAVPSEPSAQSIPQTVNPYAPQSVSETSYSNMRTGEFAYNTAYQSTPATDDANPYAPYGQTASQGIFQTPQFPNDATGQNNMLSTHIETSLKTQSDHIPEQNYQPSMGFDLSTSDNPTQSTEYNVYDPQQATKAFSSPEVDSPSQRLKDRVPVASFGFGGKLITFFPEIRTESPTSGSADFGDASRLNAAYAPPGAMTVKLQQLSDALPSAELSNYPGPLFMDGGSKSSVGKKRKQVVTWLEEKLLETDHELTYVQSRQPLSPEHTTLEIQEAQVNDLQDKILLLKVLKILIENEGRLSGTLKVEDAVRIILQAPIHTFSETSSIGKTSPVEPLIHLPDLGPNMSPNDVLATCSIRVSSLDAVQTHLTTGKRSEALKCAIDQRMWPHALIIANSLGNETWRTTVRDFVRFELGDGVADSKTEPSTYGGRESLKVLYNLLAGAGPAAIEEFLPKSSLSAPQTVTPFINSEAYGLSTMPMAPSVNGATSNSRSTSPAPIKPSEFISNLPKVSNEVLKQWRSTAAMAIANRVPGSSAFLVRLGDLLMCNNRVYAAHLIYLLSSASVPLLALENGARISLLGSSGQNGIEKPGLEVEAVMLTEVLEFALSLAPTIKNQEPFIGIPHLQAYRLALSVQYANLGLVTTANKYCEALGATLKLATKSSPFYHATLLDTIKTFSARLSAAPVAEKGNASWIARKMPRPNLDNVWQTLEGRVHKFVAGDDDATGQAPSNLAPNQSQNKVLGPFSHYSSISPGSTSGTLSRVQSSSDLAFHNNQSVGGALTGPFQYAAPSHRPASGAGYYPTHERDTRQRSISAMIPGVASSASVNWSAPGEANQQASTQQSSHSASPHQTTEFPSTSTEINNAINNPTNSGGWWEAANAYSTPHDSLSQPTFASVDDAAIPDDSSGFIDPMASFGMPSFTPSNHGPDGQTGYTSLSSNHTQELVEEDDLGFGNSSSRKNKNRGSSTDETSTNHKPESDAKATPVSDAKKEEKSLRPAPSSSWLGRWFKRDGAAGSGPVKANLGEQVSLVYDPETKRWVNKNATSTSSPPSAPPRPPTRAQTTSPTSSTRSPPIPFPTSSGPPPPPISRTNTAQPTAGRLSLESSRLMSSSLVGDPAGSNLSVGLPPGSSRPGLPPSSASFNPTDAPPSAASNTTAKKPATKKNIRSRYVEIR